MKGTWSSAQLSASAMIPSKILVYHHPSSSTSAEVYRPSRRRKKSLGDLFHNGYRVRSGPAVPEKEEPQDFWQSLVSCCRVCASWGKVPPNPGTCAPKSTPYSRRLLWKEMPSLWAGLSVMSIRQMIAFSVLLCLVYPLNADVLGQAEILSFLFR